jgi:hypothetical protein
MLRFVIRRKMLDRHSSLASETLETFDAECPDLERVLLGGSTDMNSYDYRQLMGAEVLQAAERDAEIIRLRAALDKIAEHTGSDDPCRALVQIARDTLAPNV